MVSGSAAGALAPIMIAETGKAVAGRRISRRVCGALLTLLPPGEDQPRDHHDQHDLQQQAESELIPPIPPKIP